MGQSDYRAKPADLWTTDFKDAIQSEMTRLGSNATMNNQSRDDAAAFVAQLIRQQQGVGTNLGQQALQAGAAKTAQQAAGGLASTRGVDPRLAARLIGRNNNGVQQQVAQQSQLLGAQQQLGTQDMLGGSLAQLRQGDQALSNLGTQKASVLGQLQNAQNATNVSNYYNATDANAAIEKKNAGNSGSVVGGAVGATAGVLATIFTDGAAAPAIPALTAAGAQAGGAIGQYDGGKIPGKAPVPGDHPANDIVPAKLSPGEVVVPRSIASDPDKVKKFVEALNKKKETEDPRLAKILGAKKALAELEQFYCGGMVKKNG